MKGSTRTGSNWTYLFVPLMSWDLPIKNWTDKSSEGVPPSPDETFPQLIFGYGETAIIIIIVTCKII